VVLLMVGHGEVRHDQVLPSGIALWDGLGHGNSGCVISSSLQSSSSTWEDEGCMGEGLGRGSRGGFETQTHGRSWKKDSWEK
jgi:hypothetical protein